MAEGYTFDQFADDKWDVIFDSAFDVALEDAAKDRGVVSGTDEYTDYERKLKNWAAEQSPAKLHRIIAEQLGYDRAVLELLKLFRELTEHELNRPSKGKENDSNDNNNAT